MTLLYQAKLFLRTEKRSCGMTNMFSSQMMSRQGFIEFRKDVDHPIFVNLEDFIV